MPIGEPERSPWRVLWQSELSALVALLVCATIAALYGFVDGQRIAATTSESLLSPLEAAKFSFLYTLAFGVLPVAVYGAPFYAAARSLRFPSWKTATLIGLLPGAAICLFGDRTLGSWFLGMGFAAAALTHLFFERFFGGRR